MLGAVIMLALLIVGLVNSCNAQDTVIVRHHAYTTVYAKSGHIPVLVYYTLHKSDLQCDAHIARTNNFRPDPMVAGTSLGKDYEGSGYDQGHNMSAQDNMCNAINMSECFYFTNMFPQAPNLNRGIWKRLEVEERKEATAEDSIAVFIGSFGKYKIIGPDSVIVPEYCWKVIYNYTTHKYSSYIFSNVADCSGKPSDYMKFSHEQQTWALHCINHFTKYKH